MTRAKNQDRPLYVALVALLALSACSAEPEHVASSRRALTTKKVASLQYSEYQAAMVDSSCNSDPLPGACGVKKLIEQAQQQGAILVVAPESELGQEYYEPDPKLGETPATSSSWSSDQLIQQFSQQAYDLGIYIVIHLVTITPAKVKYSTQVAFDPSGKVVGKHHKFELYGGEATTYEPGKDVMVFKSPIGNIGMLICADMYGDLRVHEKLVTTLKARVVAVSSFWTVPGGHNWQANFAKNWGVWVVGSNTTASSGRGGGVFGPDGKPLDLQTRKSPSITIAEIPVP